MSKEYDKWLHESLMQHHVVTRMKNPNKDEIEWCVCPLYEDGIGSPLCFGDCISSAVEKFKSMIELKGE